MLIKFSNSATDNPAAKPGCTAAESNSSTASPQSLRVKMQLNSQIRAVQGMSNVSTEQSWAQLLSQPTTLPDNTEHSLEPLKKANQTLD